MASEILNETREVLRRRHYSIRTETTYCGWIKKSGKMPCELKSGCNNTGFNLG